jgi:hypothetical protein
VQCSCAVLLDVSYDPLSDKEGAYGAKSFKASDGYSIEFDGVLLTVKHSGRSAAWGGARVDYVRPLVAVAAPVVVAEPVKVEPAKVEPPKPVVEAPKPAQVAQQNQRPQQQLQGKRR